MSLGGYGDSRPQGLNCAFEEMVLDGVSLVAEDVQTGKVVAMSVGYTVAR